MRFLLPPAVGQPSHTNTATGACASDATNATQGMPSTPNATSGALRTQRARESTCRKLASTYDQHHLILLRCPPSSSPICSCILHACASSYSYPVPLPNQAPMPLSFQVLQACCFSSNKHSRLSRPPNHETHPACHHHAPPLFCSREAAMPRALLHCNSAMALKRSRLPYTWCSAAWRKLSLGSM